jgi:hypothetical protein
MWTLGGHETIHLTNGPSNIIFNSSSEDRKCKDRVAGSTFKLTLTCNEKPRRAGSVLSVQAAHDMNEFDL